MSRPGDIERRLKRQQARLQLMLRTVEDDLQGLEKPIEQRVTNANQRYAIIAGKVAELDRRDLERDKGCTGTTYDFGAMLTMLKRFSLTNKAKWTKT